jgi:sterol desaturase/sphingolipid hydroxylase (fatty acid hydroxylase superfamily)
MYVPSMILFATAALTAQVPVFSMSLTAIYSISLWAVHYAGHSCYEWFGFRAAHRGHHKTYTFGDYQTPAYRPNRFDPSKLNTMAYVCVFLTIFCTLYAACPRFRTDIMRSTCIMLGAMWFENEVHRACHESTHWIRRLPVQSWQRWFDTVNQHHRLHHLYPRRNMAVVNLWIDRLFGTLSSPPSSSPAAFGDPPTDLAHGKTKENMNDTSSTPPVLPR